MTKKKIRVGAPSHSRPHGAPVPLAPPRRSAAAIVTAVMGWLAFLGTAGALIYILYSGKQELAAAKAPFLHEQQGLETERAQRTAELETKLASLRDTSIPDARTADETSKTHLADMQREVKKAEADARYAGQGEPAERRVDLDAMAASIGLPQSDLAFLQAKHQYLTATRDQLQAEADRLHKQTETTATPTRPPRDRRDPSGQAGDETGPPPPIASRHIEMQVRPEPKTSQVKLDDDLDPTRLSVTTEVIIDNKNIKDDYQNLKAVVILIGESVAERGYHGVLQRYEKTFDIKSRERVTFELPAYSGQFLKVKNDKAYGFDSDRGYLIVIYDSLGREITRKGHRSWAESAGDKILALDTEVLFDDAGNPPGAK